LHVPDTTTRTHLRFWRTSAQLATAILELASSKPSTEVSVREVVLSAAINRTTFYHHARNPTALLCAALANALEHTMDAALMEQDQPPFEQLLEATVQHVNKHERIYRTALSDPAAAGALFHTLASHLAVRACCTDPGMATDRAAALAGASAEVIRYTLATSRRQLVRDDIRVVLASARDLLHR
jgi:AcrR family transcriptional regulator